MLRIPYSPPSLLREFAEVTFDSRLADLSTNGLPLSGSVFTPPKADKWKKNAALIESTIQGIQPLARSIEEFVQAAANAYT